MIVVLTCLRPGGVMYLDPLLAAIDSETSRRKLLISDGPKPHTSWPVMELSLPVRTPPDNKEPGWRAIIEANAAGEDLLFLEDDVRPAFAGAISAALNHEVPENVAFSSLYRSKWTEPGIRPALFFVMSQAVKIPRRSFDWLIRWWDTCWGDREAVIGFDVALASAGHGCGWWYQQTERNFFDHVGVVSAARPSSNQ